MKDRFDLAQRQDLKTFWAPSSKAAKKNERKLLINGPGRAHVKSAVFDPFPLRCFAASRQKDLQKASRYNGIGLGRTFWTRSNKATKQNEGKLLSNGLGRALVFNPSPLACLAASRQKNLQEASQQDRSGPGETCWTRRNKATASKPFLLACLAASRQKGFQGRRRPSIFCMEDKP